MTCSGFIPIAAASTLTLLSGWTTPCSSVHQLVETWFVSSFKLSCLWSRGHRYLLESPAPSGIRPEASLQGPQRLPSAWRLQGPWDLPGVASSLPPAPAHGLHAEGVVRSRVSCPNSEPLFLRLLRWGCGLLAPQLLSFYPWSCPSICALPRSAPHPNRCSQRPGCSLPDSEAGVGLSQAPHGAALLSRGGAEGRVLRPGGLQLWPASASGRPGVAQRGCRPILLCPWLLSGGTDLEAGSFPPCVCWDCPCCLTADISLPGTLDPGLDPDPWCSWSCPCLSLGM